MTMMMMMMIIMMAYAPSRDKVRLAGVTNLLGNVKRVDKGSVSK